MYIAFVCFVLFDAQGGDMAPLRPYHLYGAAVLMAVMLCLGYIPGIFYRPQTGVDSLCDDLLCIAAHYACALLIHDQALRYSCILHSVAYVMEHRFLGKPNIPSMLVHATTAMWLTTAYFHGPRVTEIKSFITAVAFPGTADLIARAMTEVHRITVLWAMEI